MATMKTLNGYGFNATELNGKAASDYLQKTDTATNSAKLGGKAPEYYIQPRNLLDNSDFRNPVNQRGQTSYTGGGYSIDRWILGVSPVIVNVLGDGIEITGGDSTYNAPYVQKVPENLTGKTVTLAICDSDGVITTVTGAVQTDSTCITNTAWGSIAFYHSSSDGTLWAQINVNYGGSKIFRWAALYEGSYTAETLPPYVPKGYAAELAECQRYYYRLQEGTYFIFRFRNQHETNTYAAFDICPCITFPVPMRIVPTVSITYDITDGTLSVGAPFDCSRTSCTAPDVSIPPGGWFDLDGLVASADL